MRNYIRKTANLDPERGDALTWRREELSPLYAKTFPSDIRRDILDMAGAWFCDPPNTPTPHLDNPLADAFLQTIISRQKKKVEDYIAGCDKKVYHKDAGNMGQLEVPHVTKENQNEDKDTRREISLSSEGDDKARTDAALASPSSVGEAKKTLAMFAPEMSSHAELVKDGKPVDDWARNYLAATADASLLMVATRLYPDDIDEKDETINEILEGNSFFDDSDLPKVFFKSDGGKFIKSALTASEDIYHAFNSKDSDHAVGKSDEVFKRALLDGYISASKNSSVKNPTAWILSRLKKVAAAVTTLENAKPPNPVD